MSDVHIMPIDDLVDHDERRDCWCGPRLLVPCPDGCDDGCWRCDGGTIDVRGPADHPVMVVHNAADGRR